MIKYFETFDPEHAEASLKKGEKLNKFIPKLEDDHVKRLKKGKCKVGAGIIFVELLTEFSRISNHITNIAERIPQIQDQYLK